MNGAPNLEAVKAMLFDALGYDREWTDPNNFIDSISMDNDQLAKLAATVLQWFAAGESLTLESSEADIEAMMAHPLGVRAVHASLLTLRHTVNKTVADANARIRELEAELAAAKAPKTVWVVSYASRNYRETPEGHLARPRVARDQAAFWTRGEAEAYAETIGRARNSKGRVKYHRIGVRECPLNAQPADPKREGGGE